MSEGGRFDVPLAVPRPGTLVEAISAVAHPPAIPVSELDTVLGLYGLSRTGRPRNFALGWRSSIVSILTGSGRMVVKRYRDGWDVRTIKHEHSILAELERVGFPAVRLVRARDGDSFVTEGGGRYAVFEYVGGRSVSGRYMTSGGRRSLFLHMGDTLGRFHTALDGFTPPFEHHLGYTTSSGGAPRDLDWHIQALEALLRPDSVRHSDEIALMELMETHAGVVQARLLELDQRLTTAGLDAGVIHGDFGPHNVIFDRSGRTVVHDFELSRVDWRMVDLVGGLSRWRADAGRSFLEGYRRSSPDSVEDISMLPVVWEHYRLCGAIQSWHTFRELGDPDRLATAKHRLSEALDLRVHGPPDWIDI
jgi:Ser/Thr protein kinase RdoA (MazF antagonist)